jgi:uncharacterized protein DUF4382
MRDRIKLLIVPLIICAGLAAAVVGCHNSDSGAGTSQIRVMITDAPADHIDSAMVTISRVYLVPGDDDSERVDLMPISEGPKEFDLMVLRDGIEAFLAEKSVAPGTYAQLRLVVESAIVTLVDGVTFDDGTSTRELFVPSGMQSGIKVLLNEPLEAEGGQLTIVVVDFDVDRNFVLHGDPAVPGGVTGILFTPTLNERNRGEVALP